jgi:hypothetical protein|tara:strand:- start:1140 stop:1346 length:207 start_codon:yes stop_codon:yes gene_type:complete
MFIGMNDKKAKSLNKTKYYEFNMKINGLKRRGVIIGFAIVFRVVRLIYKFFGFSSYFHFESAPTRLLF